MFEIRRTGRLAVGQMQSAVWSTMNARMMSTFCVRKKRWLIKPELAVVMKLMLRINKMMNKTHTLRKVMLEKHDGQPLLQVHPLCICSYCVSDNFTVLMQR